VTWDSGWLLATGVVYLGLGLTTWLTFSWPDRPLWATAVLVLCTLVFLTALAILAGWL